MNKYYLSILFFAPFLMQAMQQDEAILICPSAPKKRKIMSVKSLAALCTDKLAYQIKNDKNDYASSAAQLPEELFETLSRRVKGPNASPLPQFNNDTRTQVRINSLLRGSPAKRKLDFGK